MIRTAIILGCSMLLMAPAPSAGSDTRNTLADLVKVLAESNDPQLQFDILKGMNDGLKGKRSVKMPAGWEEAAAKLSKSPDAMVRELTKALSVTFGSASAMQELRKTLVDPKASLRSRTNALDALVAVKDSRLADSLLTLLKEAPLRGAALRALAGYDDPRVPSAILAIYPELTPQEKKDALNTLASRVSFAKPLLATIFAQKIPTRDITADVVRQLRNLKDDEIETQVAQKWRESSEDKAREISRYKGMIQSSPPGDPGRGRAVFTRTCQQCHTLFGDGGKVGPDLTGGNRADLEYILQNVIDPNAVIPNDYRTSTIETKDDRVITGIVTKKDDTALTVVTANETLVIPLKEVQSQQQGQISMMPEGLIQSLSDAEIRDLVAYLRSPTQVAAKEK